MTLPRVAAIQKYWATHPPASWVAAIQMGLHKKQPPAPAKARENLDGLVAAFGLAPGKSVSM